MVGVEPSPASANRSAGTSLLIAVIAVAVALLALITGGTLRQLFWLLALAAAGLGLALGFVGLTVARAGAPRLALAVLAMGANGLLALVLVVAAVIS
jgi:hypothetical protein